MNRAELRELHIQAINEDPRLDVSRVARVLDAMLDIMSAIGESEADEVKLGDVEELADDVRTLEGARKEQENECFDAEKERDELKEKLAEAEKERDSWRETAKKAADDRDTEILNAVCLQQKVERLQQEHDAALEGRDHCETWIQELITERDANRRERAMHVKALRQMADMLDPHDSEKPVAAAAE